MCAWVTWAQEESLGWHWWVGGWQDNPGKLDIMHWWLTLIALTLRAWLMSPLSPVPSKISDFMKHRAQFIVAHPCNPPYHTPMVELVPAPWTSEEVRAGTRSLMQEVGQGPVSLSRELPGFVLNRYSSSQSGALVMWPVPTNQDAVFVTQWVLETHKGRDRVPPRPGRGDEGWDGDEVRLHGAHGDHSPQRWGYPELLRQIRGDHLQCFGGPRAHPHWLEVGFVFEVLQGLTVLLRQESEVDKDEVRALQAAMIKTVPMEKLNERRVWRDKRLAALAKLKRDMDKE